MRRGLSAFVLVQCARCRLSFPPSKVDVDHRVALADGGLDVIENLQILCRPCHVEKTTGEGRARRHASN